MHMAAGVTLSERNHVKKGEDLFHNSRMEGGSMSRRDYEAMVRSGGAGYPVEVKVVEEKEEPANIASAVAPPAPVATEAAAVAESRKASDAERTLNSNRGDSKLTPHAPLTPRAPEQPIAPFSVRRVQMKRDALGYSLSTRERVPTGGGSRFPDCAPKPVL